MTLHDSDQDIKNQATNQLWRCDSCGDELEVINFQGDYLIALSSDRDVLNQTFPYSYVVWPAWLKWPPSPLCVCAGLASAW